MPIDVVDLVPSKLAGWGIQLALVFCLGGRVLACVLFSDWLLLCRRFPSVVSIGGGEYLAAVLVDIFQC